MSSCPRPLLLLFPFLDLSLITHVVCSLLSSPHRPYRRLEGSAARVGSTITKSVTKIDSKFPSWLPLNQPAFAFHFNTDLIQASYSPTVLQSYSPTVLQLTCPTLKRLHSSSCANSFIDCQLGVNHSNASVFQRTLEVTI